MLQRKIISDLLLRGVMLFSIMVCLGACAPKHTSYSAFVNLPSEGWQAGNPVRFELEYGDSSITYDLSLAVRHTSTYSFNNLCLVVDLISDQGKVARREVDLPIADAFGGFKGGGFGAYYQVDYQLATDLKPGDATHVVVWPAMKGRKMLLGLNDIGVFVQPHKR